MKSIKFTIVFLAAFIAFILINDTKAQSVNVNFSMFQNELAPHGTWMNNARFGQVWIYNDPSFRPYATNGHWEYTNFGWSWVSDFNWGWAPFHYGRWEYDDAYGWMWIPGYEWANAWVSWSQYDNYYGWAPLGYGARINVSFGAVPYNRWNFIPCNYMGSRDFYRYHVSTQNNYFIHAVTINNYYSGREGRFTRGPERRDVERYTNNRIEERHIDYRDRLINRYNNNSGGNNNNNNNNYNQGRTQAGNNREQTGNPQINNMPQNGSEHGYGGNNTFPRHDNNTPLQPVRTDGNYNNAPVHQSGNAADYHYQINGLTVQPVIRDNNLPDHPVIRDSNHQPVRNSGGYNDVPHNNNMPGRMIDNNPMRRNNDFEGQQQMNQQQQIRHQQMRQQQLNQQQRLQQMNQQQQQRQQQTRSEQPKYRPGNTQQRETQAMPQHNEQRNNQPQRSYGGNGDGSRRGGRN